MDKGIKTLKIVSNYMKATILHLVLLFVKPFTDDINIKSGYYEFLQRAFKSHKVTLVHKPFNSLRSQLVRVKDKTENLKRCGTVYHIHCEQCDKDYVGETSRLLET